MNTYKIKLLLGNKTLINGGLFSIYSFWGRGMSFILLMLLANYIPPTDYGMLSLFNTVVSFVTVFMALNTEGYFSISFFKKSEDDFKKNFTAIIILGVITMMICLMLVNFGGKTISSVLKLSQSLIIFAIIIAFLQFIFNIQQNYYRIKEKVIIYGCYNVGNAFLNFFLSLILVIYVGQGWIGRINAQLLCAIIFAVLSFGTFVKSKLFRFSISANRFKEIILWGLPMIPHHAAGWIRQGLDRYIVNFFYSTYYVGLFSFALNVANIIEMVGLAFNSTNSVTLFKTLSKDDYSNENKISILRRQTKLIGSIYLIVSIIVVVFMSIITFLFLPKYVSSIFYIWILSIASFLKCL